MKDRLASKSEIRQAKSKSFLLPRPLYRLTPEGIVQITGGYSHDKDPD